MDLTEVFGGRACICWDASLPTVIWNAVGTTAATAPADMATAVMATEGIRTDQCTRISRTDSFHRKRCSGSGVEPFPANLRNHRGAASSDMGCWKIVVGSRTENEGEEDESTVSVRVFANQFYLKGEVLVELELEDAVEDFVCQGELSSGEEYTEDDKPFVALKVPATTASAESPALVGYADIAELQEAQFDVAYVVKPLYKFTHSGAVAVDFRNCPALQVAEVL